jgi:Membrane bound FAD containing D-sorbitol dehydrogenase
MLVRSLNLPGAPDEIASTNSELAICAHDVSRFQTQKADSGLVENGVMRLRRASKSKGQGGYMASSDDSTKKSKSRGMNRRQFLHAGALVAGATALPPAAGAGATMILQEGPLPGKRPPRQTAPPPTSPEAVNVKLEKFIHLSKTLTGFEHLDLDLASEYLDRCSERGYMIDGLSKLIDLHESISEPNKADALKRQIVGNSAPSKSLFPVAEQLIYLWYVGGFFDVPSNPIAGDPNAADIQEDIQDVTVKSNVATVTTRVSLPPRWRVGASVTFFGLTNATWLNGQTGTISGVLDKNRFTFAFKHGDYATATDTGTVNSPKTWDYGDPSHYFKALVWPAIGVEPPMARGGNYGYWEQAPGRSRLAAKPVGRRKAHE